MTCRGSLLTCADCTGGGTVAELLTLPFLVLSQDSHVHFLCQTMSIHALGTEVYGVTCVCHLADTWTANTRLSSPREEQVKCVTVCRIS